MSYYARIGPPLTLSFVGLLVTTLPEKSHSTDATPTPAPSDPPTLSSDQLLHGQREVLIQHGTEVYRLRLTRQGKLILQK